MSMTSVSAYVSASSFSMLLVSIAAVVVAITVFGFAWNRLSHIRGVQRGVRKRGGACPWHQLQMTGFTILGLSAVLFYSTIFPPFRLNENVRWRPLVVVHLIAAAGFWICLLRLQIMDPSAVPYAPQASVTVGIVQETRPRSASLHEGANR